MKHIWILKLKLDNKFREDIEDFLMTLNAAILSLDAENDSNSFKPKLFNITAFFLKKPKIYFINMLVFNFNIQPKQLIFQKKNIKDLYKNNIQPLKPINIGRFIFLEKKNLKDFKIYKNIIIPAGLGFGTGHHPTTQGILFMLNKIYIKKNILYNNMIDVGCGSGILGITMAKLWKKRVELIDLDNQAITTSIFNAKLNFLKSFIKVKKANSLNITDKLHYDIIAINILAKPILKNISLINKKLNKNGRVIISGILQHQKYMILNKLRYMGLILELECRIQNWVTLLIKKN